MEDRDQNVKQAFAEMATGYPDRTAVVYLGSRFSFGRLMQWSRALSSSLAEMGVGPGDRVLLYLPNGPQWVVAFLAVLRRGAVAVPVSPIFPAADLSQVAVDSGATVAFTTDGNYGQLARVLIDTSIGHVIVSRSTDLLPFWKRTLERSFDLEPKGRVPWGTPRLARLVRQRSVTAAINTGPDDLAAILYTGGTTRAPKGVPYTHRLLLDPVREQLAIPAQVIPPEDNRILLAAPLFHITGLTFGFMAMALVGGTVILLPRMNLDGLMDAVQRERATSLYAGPGLYRMILEHDRRDDYDLSSLKYCFSGGDVFPGQVGQRWKDLYGLTIGPGYGATETGGGVSLHLPHEDSPPHSVGRPLASKRLLLVDPDTLSPTPPGRPGELLVGSNPMIHGYWNRPADTERAFVTLNGRLWYRTGDIMRRDADGHLYFVDRVADAAVSEGRRVSVSFVEGVLQEHPAITGACVVGLSDDKRGQRLKAFVVLKEGTRGISGGELTSWLKTRLPSYMIPQYIEFRDVLPKTKVGKLLRRELRDEEQARRGADTTPTENGR